MSSLKKTIAKFVAEKVENTAIYGAVKHVENTRSVGALVNKSTANYMLFIKRRSVSIKRGFTVYDEFDNKKYVIKTDSLTFGYPCIRLYDTENHEIGNVELASKTGMGTYTMSLDGKKIGTLTRKMSVKIQLDLSCNGWHLNSNLMQSNFVVTDKTGNQVMMFNRALSSHDTCVLEMNNREHEIMGLLLVMAVEIILYGND